MFGIADWEIKAVAIFLALAGLATGAYLFIHQQRQIGAAQFIAQDNKTKLDDSEASRAKEQATTAKMQEAQDAETKRRTAAEASFKRSNASAVGLRDELAATRASIAENAASAPASCPSAAPTVDLLTNLLGQCSSERRIYAKAVDDAAGAGQLCERSFDSLNP